MWVLWWCYFYRKRSSHLTHWKFRKIVSGKRRILRFFPRGHRLFRRTVKNKGIPTQIFSSETQNSRFCHYTPQNLDFFIFHIFFGNFTTFWTDTGGERYASSTSPKSRTDTLSVPPAIPQWAIGFSEELWQIRGSLRIFDLKSAKKWPFSMIRGEGKLESLL